MITKIPKFRRCVIQNFPFIEEDFDALTDYQLLSKVVEYLNNVIDVTNAQSETIDEYTQIVIDLKDYVEHYFDNLDVQLEINNKLDVMASDGTLLNLITPYLDTYTEGITTQFNEFKAGVESDVTTINNKVNALTSYAPVPVASTDDMTDTSKIYLLTTSGYWYYYDGEAWSAGGVYAGTPNALLSIVGSMIASGSISKDKLSDKINILSKATAIQPGKAVTNFVSGTGPTLTDNEDSNVLIFDMSSLPDSISFHMESDKTSGNSNILYVKYDSEDLTSYNITYYVTLKGREKEYDTTTNTAYIKKDSTYDTLIVTVDPNYDINSCTPAKTSTWKTGEDIKLNATNIESVGTVVYNQSCQGYDTSAHTPINLLDYRFKTVTIELTTENKKLIESSYFYIESTPSVMPNRMLLWTAGVGQKMHNLSTLLASPAYDSTTKLLNIGAFLGNNLNNYDYMQLVVPSSYDFPFWYSTYVGPNNLNYSLFTQGGHGELVLPSKFKALQSKNLCFYFQTFIANANTDNIDIKQITNANINTSRVSWFNKDNATSNLSCTVRAKKNANSESYDLSKTIGIEVVNANAGSGTTKKVLMIGDSLTHAGHYTQRLLDLFANDSMNIELLGTMHKFNNDNKFEGRSAWNTSDYMTDSTSHGFTNPFYNPSTETFDFSYYMTQQGYTGVDYVFINLGTNDLVTTTYNAATTINNINAMIASIHQYNASIKIGLWLPPIRGLCENVDQNNLLESFETLTKINKLFIDTYDNNANLYLIPVYTNVNPYLDFPMVEADISDTSSYSLTYTNNKLHPSVDGYYHIGDVFFAWIKYFASL